MIQRFLGTTLQAGLAAIQSDLTLLDDVFQQFDLSATEQTAIRTWFGANPPGVKFQYARTDDKFPLYSIILGNEEETDLFIGNDGELIDASLGDYVGRDDPDFGSDVKSSLWQSTYQIWCCAEHPDGTQYLYEVAKAIFLSADLDACGLHSIKFSGMDLALASQYVPEHLFIRTFQIRGKSEFERLDRSARLRKAFKVEGIHIDKTGSPSDVGDVKTLVSVTGNLESSE